MEMMLSICLPILRAYFTKLRVNTCDSYFMIQADVFISQIIFQEKTHILLNKQSKQNTRLWP